MLEALKISHVSIYWESYMFTDGDADDITKEVFKTLADKAREGVSVKIIADYWGSFFFSAKARQVLEEAGAEFLFFRGHGLLGRNHKKLLIVDGKVAFIGGVNLVHSHRYWLDLHIRLEGKIVNYFVRSFAKTYYLAGGKDKINFKKSAISKIKVRVLEHWPYKKKSALKRHYKKAFAEAKNNITIVTPYLIPHIWLIKALHGSLKRGVVVDIIMPERTDFFIANLVNYFFASLIYKPGINFYFIKQMIHAKALLVDKKEGLVGSQNLDALSFDHLMEGGVVFQRRDMIKELIFILNSWKGGSYKMIFKDENKRWHQRVLEVIFKFFRPIN